MSPTSRLLILWVAVIVAVVVPWTAFQTHAHWQNIAWVPFLSPPVRLRDVVLNMLLYMPFGYWHGKQSGRPLWQTGALALLLSSATEFTQVFSHGRFPSATDVVSNVAGAICGGLSSLLRIESEARANQALPQHDGNAVRRDS